MLYKDFEIPMVDVKGNRYVSVVSSKSLFAAILSVQYVQTYAAPILDGMKFTEQELAVIEHSARVKDMRHESLGLVLKTIGLSMWQTNPAQERKNYLEREIKLEKVSCHWTNTDHICRACNVLLPAGTDHLWIRGGYCCDYHCFGNKLISDRAKLDGH